MIFSKMKHQKEFNLYIKLKIQFLLDIPKTFTIFAMPNYCCVQHRKASG
jgi:hypothetical protein